MTRRPALGYALAATAATLWALNASLGRSLLDDGVAPLRLTELRSSGSFLLLLAFLALTRPAALKVRREDIPALAWVGIAGLAIVQGSYFVSIDHLKIGVALAIQYTAPMLILLWLRFFHGRHMSRSLWGAVAVTLTGCFFVVGAYHPGGLDGFGVLAAAVSAITFAIYIVGSERAGTRHEAVTTLVYAFGFASLFWAVAEPWWTFPFDKFGSLENVALGASVVVAGTLVPFGCMVAALRHIPAPRAAVVATLEPVLAALFAFLIHDESLDAVQLAGGASVVAGVIWAQSHRPDLESEAAPPGRLRAPSKQG
jgi:drug/metabolite transporter (DMT)-like permease